MIKKTAYFALVAGTLIATGVARVNTSVAANPPAPPGMPGPPSPIPPPAPPGTPGVPNPPQPLGVRS